MRIESSSYIFVFRIRSASALNINFLSKQFVNYSALLFRNIASPFLRCVTATHSAPLRMDLLAFSKKRQFTPMYYNAHELVDPLYDSKFYFVYPFGS